ncbi:MAG: D-alanine--D-alanine ligase [Streptosporangiales bacterium]|nr:D-alanine--D-alanine ligase [Streptosporangiales bacterium]
MSDLSGPVVVLAGGLSNERDVSLRSGVRIVDALREVGVEVYQRDVDAELIPALTDDHPAAVFPVVHGATGEDGAVREVLELLGVPYVGARPNACRLAFDKTIAKAVVAEAGITTPAGTALPHATFRDLGAGAVLERIAARLKPPLVVKPARGGSALGMSVVHDTAELPAAMVGCFSYGDTALVEHFIAGTELAVGVVDTGSGPEALPPVEIVPEDASGYDYAARYTAGETKFFCPARLDDAVIEAVQQTALRAHAALGLRHISRSDLIVDERGEVYLLEVNVAPGMTETSTLPMAATHAGKPFGQLCRDLIEVAVASAP